MIASTATPDAKTKKGSVFADIFCGALAVCAICIAAIDVRTRFATESICWCHGSTDEWVTTLGGYVVYQHAIDIPPAAPRVYGYRRSEPATPRGIASPIPIVRISHALGNSFARVSEPPVTGWYWLMPMWQPFLLAAIYPVIRGWRWVKKWWVDRHEPGMCRRCGYDLRATPVKGAGILPRCPECGRAQGSAVAS